MNTSPEDTAETPGVVMRVGQIPNLASCAHYLATAPLFAERAVFVVCENDVDRHALVDALPIFSGKSEKKRKIFEWTGDMLSLSIMPPAPDFVIVDALTLEEEPLPAPRSYEHAALNLRAGEEQSLTQLKRFFAAYGYDRDTTANLPGRWAVRGEVADVFIDRPYRIAFDGEMIESIAPFDPETGKAGVTRASLLLPPLSMNGRSTLLDYMPEDALVVLFHQEPLDTPHDQLVLDALTLPDQHNGGYRETKAYHMRYDNVLKDAAAMERAVALTNAPKKVNGIFKDRPAVTVAHVAIGGRGFAHEASRTIAFTDRSLGIGEDEKKKRADRVRQAMLQELAPGDFVVHMFHGIARFAGMQVMHVNELDREYFVLEYAERDKIYVPVELAERIDKYMGDPNPTLNRLSDASWHEMVGRVKAHALEMARSLLHLYARRSVSRAPRLAPREEERELDEKCAFELTEDQNKSLGEVFSDTAQDKPMDRLLCGDVGFGKTEIAIRTAFRSALNGYQAVVLAPTTVLVQQHFDTFNERLREFGVNVQQLSRLKTKKEQAQVVEGLKLGSVDIVIGTHRLLSKDIDFKRLGLIIIDEEQRFGVRAKETLKKLRANAH
ncbi:MAG: DEAD/DEAH box helicase, partial [Candidatus Kerfeldbacteria bacterium]